MKFRSRDSANEDITLNMTAMIDIVFQLLVFFIMTFKVVAMEADFKIRMPRSASQPQVTELPPTVIRVKLEAGKNNEIAAIDVNTDAASSRFSEPDMYQRLTEFVEKVVNQQENPSDSEEVEVEFDIDEVLKYGFTVKAIEAVSGKIEGDSVRTLVEKIKFRNN